MVVCCLVAMKLNQYSILVIWVEGRYYTVRMWKGALLLNVCIER